MNLRHVSPLFIFLFFISDLSPAFGGRRPDKSSAKPTPGAQAATPAPAAAGTTITPKASAPAPVPQMSQPQISAPATTTPPAQSNQVGSTNTSAAPASASTQAPAATPVAVSKPEYFDPSKGITFDFEKVKLSSFIDFVSNLKELNYIPNTDTSSIETSLTIRNSLSVEQAYNMFLTVLETNGFAHVKVGDLYKIVKKDAKYAEPWPIFLGKPASELPDSDATVRFVTFLKNIGVADVDALLKSLLTPGAQVISLAALNGLVITDKAFNIKSAMRVINELDSSSFQEMVSIIRLEETNASEVKDFLEPLLKKPDGSTLARLISGASEGGIDFFPAGVRIIAEERTNSLILLGSEIALKKVETFITNFIDKTTREVETPLHIYECQYMDCDVLKSILADVTQSNSAAGKFGGVRGGMKFFGPMKFDSDKDGNRLIISCADKQDWKLIEKTIKDLDKPQPQVAIETLIVEISSSDIRQLGGQIKQLSDGVPIPGVNIGSSTFLPMQLNSDIGNILGSLQRGLTSIIQGETIISLGTLDIWAIIKTLQSFTSSSIIAKPFLTIANRAEGTTEYGETRRVAMEEAIPDSTGVISQNSAKGYTTVPAKTTIKYVPQINPEGLVTLKIDINLSDFKTNNDDRTEKSLSTSVTVADGQALVLGGFIKTSASETQAKTPVLSNIPIVKWLFQNKKRQLDKSYIFIFVSTTIQKPRSAPGVNLYSKLKLHDAYGTVKDALDTQWGKDPVHNWFFNSDKEEFSHKVVDFANARYQPTTVDIKNDPYYRSAVGGINKPGTKHKISQVNNEDVLMFDEHNNIVTQKIQDKYSTIGSKVTRFKNASEIGKSEIETFMNDEEYNNLFKNIQSLKKNKSVAAKVSDKNSKEIERPEKEEIESKSTSTLSNKKSKKDFKSFLNQDDTLKEELLAMLNNKKNKGSTKTNNQKSSEPKTVNNQDAMKMFENYLNQDNTQISTKKNHKKNELLEFLEDNKQDDLKLSEKSKNKKNAKETFANFINKEPSIKKSDQTELKKEDFLKLLKTDEPVVVQSTSNKKPKKQKTSLREKKLLLKKLLDSDEANNA